MTPLALMETADASAVEQALATAHALFRNRAQLLSKIRRLAILEKAVSIMQSCQEDLALVAASEGGKPLIDSRVEVQRAIESIQLCSDCLRHDAGQSIAMGSNQASGGKLACTLSEPIGVVVAISAFNHPLNLIAHQVGPAIANGCPVIVKPAASTPLSCYRFIAILREAGLPHP